MAKSGPTGGGNSGLLYSCIAYKTTVLTEHSSTTTSSHASSLASTVLSKISHKTDQKLTYAHGADLVHYIASADSTKNNSSSSSSQGNQNKNEDVNDRGLTFLVVAHADLGRRIPFGFLIEVRRRFLDIYGGEHPPKPTAAKDDPGQNPSNYFSTLPPYGTASFNATLRQLMQSYSTSDAAQSDAIATARAELADAKITMTDNIERVLDRGERIDLLVNQTDRLGGSARDFRVRSRTLRRAMWWKNVKLMALAGVVVVFLIYLLVGMGCGFPGWSCCIHH